MFPVQFYFEDELSSSVERLVANVRSEKGSRPLIVVGNQEVLSWIVENVDFGAGRFVVLFSDVTQLNPVSFVLSLYKISSVQQQ